MVVLRRLKEVLDRAKISYEVYNHPRAFTAQEIAATQHITGRTMAKVVMLNVDGSFVMAVLPLPVFVDPALERYEAIFFNAGNHQHTVRLKYRDFKSLVKPETVTLTEARTKKAA